MIKAVIFDCFGVLTTHTWKEFWSSLPTKKQQEHARELNRAYDSGAIAKEDFLRQLNETTGRSNQEVETVLFGKPEQKNEQLISYIHNLKPKYKISVLSNVATDWIREELLTSDEQTLFDDMVLSFEVKMTKPDPHIFRLAAERLEVEPKDCIFVDDIEDYCYAASAEGMQAILYQNFGQMKQEMELILAKP